MNREEFRKRIRKEMVYTSKDKIIADLVEERLWDEQAIRKRYAELEAEMREKK